MATIRSADVGIEGAADEAGPELLDPDLDALDAGPLGRAALDQRDDEQALAGGEEAA